MNYVNNNCLLTLIISLSWSATCSAFCIQQYMKSTEIEKKISDLNEEGWCNYIQTIHHRLTRPTSSWTRMNGWSSSSPHYIQLKLIIQAEQAYHPRVDAPLCDIENSQMKFSVFEQHIAMVELYKCEMMAKTIRQMLKPVTVNKWFVSWTLAHYWKTDGVVGRLREVREWVWWNPARENNISKGGYTYAVFGKDQQLYRFVLLFAEQRVDTLMQCSMCHTLICVTFVHFHVWKIWTFLGMTNTEPNLLSLGRVLLYTLIVISQIFTKYHVCVATLTILWVVFHEKSYTSVHWHVWVTY